MPNEIVSELVSDKLGSSDVLKALSDDSSDSSDSKESKKKESAEELILPDDSDDEESDDDEPEAEAEETESEPDEVEEKIELEDEKPEGYIEVPSRKKVLAKYPTFFKEFPGIERAMYREKAYTDVFPSIPEAKHAKEVAENYHALQSDVFSGNITNVLASVKEANPKAFGKITSNLLDTLKSVDKEAWGNTINYVVKSAISGLFKSGKSQDSGDDSDGRQLMIAAQVLNRFLYNNVNIEDPKSLAVEEKEDPRDKELSERELNFNRTQLKTAVDDVTNRTQSIIKSGIEKYIDPKGLMSDYVKSKAISDAMLLVDKELSSDSRFTHHIDNLWREAYKNNYSSESKDKIRAALKNRAQSFLLDIVKKVRADALKGSKSSTTVVKKKKEEDDSEDEKPRVRQEMRSNNNSQNRDRNAPTKLNLKSVMKALG